MAQAGLPPGPPGPCTGMAGLCAPAAGGDKPPEPAPVPATATPGPMPCPRPPPPAAAPTPAGYTNVPLPVEWPTPPVPALGGMAPAPKGVPGGGDMAGVAPLHPAIGPPWPPQPQPPPPPAPGGAGGAGPQLPPPGGAGGTGGIPTPALEACERRPRATEARCKGSPRHVRATGTNPAPASSTQHPYPAPSCGGKAPDNGPRDCPSATQHPGLPPPTPTNRRCANESTSAKPSDGDSEANDNKHKGASRPTAVYQRPRRTTKCFGERPWASDAALRASGP